MKKIANPEKYEVGNTPEDGILTGVYCGAMFDLTPARVTWRTTKEEDGEDVLTLAEIAEQLSDTSQIITVIVDEPMRGEILQYGNYGDEWWLIGTTCGYA